MHGQHLMLGIPEGTLSSADIALLKRVQPSGIILFSRNIQSPEQTRKLTDDLRDLLGEDLIIGVDQEGGRVSRTKDIAPPSPGARQLVNSGERKFIAEHAFLTGSMLGQLGINLSFAPVLDIDFGAALFSALPERCYGSDSQSVIDNAGLFNRVMRKQHVLSCAKHFPSCSHAAVDPHHELPNSDVTKDQLLASDLLPYTALMPELDSIMTCHVHFTELDAQEPGLPASLSKNAITGLLRTQLGFDGHLIFTDDLDMGAVAQRYERGDDVRRAIEAGNDIAMICHKPETADIALAALKTLPDTYLEDTERRLKKIRKRLKFPPAFDQKRWSSICDDTQKLFDKFKPEKATGFSQVANY